MTITPPLARPRVGQPDAAAPGVTRAAVQLAASPTLHPGDDLTGGTWRPAPDRRAANTVGFTKLEFGYEGEGGLMVGAALAFLRFTAPVRPDGPGRYEAPFLDGWMALATTLSADGPRLHVEVVNPTTGKRAEGWYVLDRRGRHPAGHGRRAR